MTVLKIMIGHGFSQPLYIAWWDYFDEKKPAKTKTITIDVGNVASIKITETIPNVERGKDLKDKG
ncbi:MAG: hypothetical protein ACPL1G_10335 [Thermodesulfovibrionales bacterium]